MGDLDLWRQLQSGDRGALERIYREQAPLLLQYGGRFALNEALVEDCVQDLFVDLWRRRESLSATGSIRRYLLVALRRRILREVEKQRRHNTNADPEGLDFQAELAVDQQLMETEGAGGRIEQLREAFAQLSDRQREILYLKYYTGLDYAAIGEIMDLNYQSARNLVARALKKLKDLLVLLLFLFLWKIFSVG